MRKLTVLEVDCTTGEQCERTVELELVEEAPPPPSLFELALRAIAADPAIAPETAAAIDAALAPAAEPIDLSPPTV